MKNAVAIALLFCVALFHFGYYAFYFSVNRSIEAGWEDKIYEVEDQNLEESILSIPIRAPYLANQEDFQATNTRFEKDAGLDQGRKAAAYSVARARQDGVD